MRRLLALERIMGRKRVKGHKQTRGKYRPRIIDLDLLFFNKETIDTRVLKVPHPRLHETALVQSRMRHFEDASVDRLFVEEQQIKIDYSRAVFAARLLATLDPLAAHDALEREHPAHQDFGRQLGFDLDDAVEERALEIAHRLGLVDRGLAHDPRFRDRRDPLNRLAIIGGSIA